MKKSWLTLVLSCLFWAAGAVAQVNINTASPEQLDSLKGIGPVKARAIVDYRRKNGPFKSVDDLQNVPGIGPAIVQDLRRDVTVGAFGRAVAGQSASAPAAPARPAMPGKAAVEAKAPLAKPAKPVMPAPAGPSLKPAAPAKPATEPVAPLPESAKPARPPAPARPAGL